MINAKYCNIQTNENMNEFNVEWYNAQQIEFFKMDICELTDKEIENERVDAIISDLPFGHKCGSHKMNQKLYPKMLSSMHRILKKDGKALLITMDRKLLIKALDANSDKWKYKTMEIDVGGFN